MLYTDHEGNTFKSVQAMADHWNINVSTLKTRLQRGMPIKQALTTPLKNAAIKDHLGQPFDSTRQMCDHWGVKHKIFNDRKRRGWPLEECLTGRKQPHYACANACQDHLGNSYPSVTAMCQHYGVNPTTFKGRIKRGASIEQALTDNFGCGRYSVKDHLGNEYPALQDMLDAYGISYNAFFHRKKSDMPLAEILTKPTRNVRKEVMDHTGKRYATINEMCAAYGVGRTTYKDRIARGWSKKEALTSTVQIADVNDLIDPYGHQLETLDAMLEHYHCSHNQYQYRRQAGYCWLEILGIIPIVTSTLKLCQVTDNLSIISSFIDDEDGTCYFKCIDEIGENLYTRNELLQIYSEKVGAPIAYPHEVT